MKPPLDLLRTTSSDGVPDPIFAELYLIADGVAADHRWADDAIEELKTRMRRDIQEIRVRALWPYEPLRENMILRINLLKSQVLFTIGHVRDFREHLVREARMLPPSTEYRGRPIMRMGLDNAPVTSLKSALAQIEMELRVRWNIARARVKPGLLN